MKYLWTILFAGLSFFSFGQNLLLDFNKKLDSIAGDHQHRSGFMMDPWDDFDRESYDSIYNLFSFQMKSISADSMFHLSLKTDSSYIHTITSLDSNLKIFQWEYINGGSMEEFECYILFKDQDTITLGTNNFWVNHIYTLDAEAQVYLLIGYVQGCSTCFQDFAWALNLHDDLKHFESEEYRYSYFNADVITYNPKLKQLIINYDNVSSDYLSPQELSDLNEILQYSNGKFISNKKK
ncbi:hypothetical protein KFE94_14685 [bacterium SCSIO 12643]|nr:hypothetical protein KFE94_14685 [bacterium SCSIO 12643]